LPGFTFVGREAELAAFRQALDRPGGELFLVAGAEGTGKSHLLRQLRYEAERAGRHVVQHCCLGHLLDADLRQYAVIGALAAAHEAAVLRPGEAAEAGMSVRLVPNPREFFGHLLGEDRRPVAEKLLGLLAVASDHLSDDACLVLLLDLGRAEGKDAFPVEFLARRLPDRVKLAIAANELPEGVEGLAGATLVRELPPLGEGEAKRLLEFHHPRGAPVDALVAPAIAKFRGNPLLTDMAAKLVAGSPNPVGALADLPAAAAGLCQQLLARTRDEARALVECVARVPSGLGTAALRAFLNMADTDVQRVLLSDEVRNVVVTRRAAGGAEAVVFHETFADLFLGERGPEVAAFHKRAAAHFLATAQKNPRNVEALGAHSYHIRLSGDKVQFMQDFPRTLKPKQNLGLLHLLASEYRLLLLWSRGGDAPVNRPMCMAHLARIYQQLGEYQEALRNHRDALEVYQKQSDKNSTAAQLASIAGVLCDMGHPDEAVKSLEQAMAINEAAGNKAALASDLASLGALQERVGRLHDALRSHQRALELFRGLRNELDAASELARMAGLHRKLGNPRDAVSRYQEAWRLNSRSNATRAAVADLRNLGAVFQELADMEKAITCLEQALELDHNLGDRHAEAEDLRSLGAMHIKLGEPDEAARCLQQAVALAHSFGDPGGEARGTIALAQAHVAAGRHADARRLLEQAVALTARLRDPEAEARARAALEGLGQPPPSAPLPEPPAPQEATVLEQPPARAFADPSQAAAAQDRTRQQQEPTPMALPDEINLDDDADAPAPLGPEPSALEAALVAPAEAAAAAPAPDVVAALRAELAQAKARIAELEAEVLRQKQVADAFKEIVSKAMQAR